MFSYGQIDKKANKDPVKNTEIENSRPGATISNSNQKPLIKESDTNNMTNIQRSDSLKRPNTLYQAFKPNSKPTAKIGNAIYTVFVPNLKFEVVSLSTDLEDGKNILYVWKNVPGNQINLKIEYQVSNSNAFFKVEQPGVYKIRHVVVDKGKKIDSIDFVIIGVNPNESTNIAAKKSSSIQQASNISNFSPTAKIEVIGGKHTISSDKLPLLLSSASVDPENSRMTYQWTQIRGRNCTLESPLSSSTKVLNLTEGEYSFKLEVKDANGLNNFETVDISVISGSSSVASNLINSSNPNIKSDNLLKPEASISKEDKIPSLKGGPEYALLDLVFPGVGHYYTSGDYTGFGKKKFHFITTMTVGFLAASSLYFKIDSEHDYKTYKSMVIEYQTNDLGVQTGGQRGGIEKNALKYYDSAKLKDQVFKGLIITAGSVVAGDAILTLFKGLINKGEYNRRYKLGKYGLHVDPISKQYYGLVNIKLNR